MRRKKTAKEWLEATRLLQPVGDKLVEIGWATSYGHGPAGVRLVLTPLGEKMFKRIWRVQKQLAKVDFRSSDLKPLSILVQMSAQRDGWK